MIHPNLQIKQVSNIHQNLTLTLAQNKTKNNVILYEHSAWACDCRQNSYTISDNEHGYAVAWISLSIWTGVQTVK